MIRFLLLTLLTTSWLDTVTAQADSTLLHWHLKTVINIPIRTFATDKIHQIYAVTPENILIKYNTDGTELFRYSNIRMGYLQSIDATDPFQILLFYPDYRTVQVLDRTLSPVGQWRFENEDTRCIAMSADNSLWIYDAWSDQLKKMDRNNQVLNTSPALSVLTRGISVPTSMTEQDNILYTLLPGKGIFCFDRYGQPVSTLPYIPESGFQISGQQLYFRQDSLLLVYHLTDLLTRTFLLPEAEIAATGIRMEDGYLFCSDNNGIRVYRD